MSDEQWIPGSKKELISAIEHEWKLLMDVVAKLDKANKLATPDEGGWSPKDNLAHLAEWMNALMGYHMDRRPRHEVLRVPEEVTKDWDMEVINPVLFERNHNRPTKDVLDELSLKSSEGPLNDVLNDSSKTLDAILSISFIPSPRVIPFANPAEIVALLNLLK